MLRPGRFLAPLALLVAAAVVYGVVHATLLTHDHKSKTPTTATSSSKGKHPKAAHRKSHKTRYTVRRGDSLSVIAERTGVSLDRLEQLNPHALEHGLQIGQRLKLVPAHR